MKVLLAAFTGKAAYLINGSTLHTAFALPLMQSGGLMRQLSDDIANMVRSDLNDLNTIVIDEISMIGSDTFNRVSTRSVQIKGRKLPFGGCNVIVVPVGDRAAFLPPEENEMSILAGLVLWVQFKFFELTEIMRQKDEKEFIEALNNLAIGQMTDADVELIRSREVIEKDVRSDDIRLYLLIEN